MVAFDYKRGTTTYLYSINVLITIVGAATVLARGKFEDPRPNFAFWDTTESISIGFRDTQVPGDRGYQYKTLMWTLRFAACWLQDHEWKEITWQGKFVDQPIVGYGALVQRIIGVDQKNLTAIKDSEDGEEGASFFALEADAGDKGGLEDAEVTTDKYAVNPLSATYQPFDVYALMINILINLAPKAPDAFSTGFHAYYPEGDLSLALTATSKAAAPNFQNKYIITSLADVASKLPRFVQTELSWKEVKWLIRLNGAIIGRGLVVRGQIPPGKLDAMVQEGDSADTFVENM